MFFDYVSILSTFFISTVLMIELKSEKFTFLISYNPKLKEKSRLIKMYLFIYLFFDRKKANFIKNKKERTGTSSTVQLDYIPADC